MNLMEKGQKYVMNTYGRFPVAIEHGEGLYVYDIDGKKYLDFVSGIAVNALGHNYKKLVDTIAEQAGKLIHISNLYYTEPQVKLAELLVENTCFDKVFFCNSGAESIEGALKLARKYAKMKGNSDKTHIITMKNSFHGRTYGAISATGQTKYQKGLDPLVPNITNAIFNDIDSLKEQVTSETCAILLESIQGEGGVISADMEYLKEIRAICDEKDILLMFDEIQTGIGRTGKLFGYMHYGIEPDVIATAKGLAGGVPMGALLAKDAVACAFEPGDHASTFGGNPLAAAAGVCVLEELLQNGVIDNVVKQEKYLDEKLNELKAEFPTIKEIRGKGFLKGIATNTPPKDVVAKCLAKGLLVVGAGDDCIRLLPALIAENSHIDEGVGILREVFAEL